MISMLNTLFFVCNSLFLAFKFPVPLIREFADKSLCRQRNSTRYGREASQNRDFPCIFPDSRECPTEKGSQETGSSSKESPNSRLVIRGAVPSTVTTDCRVDPDPNTSTNWAYVG